MRNAAEVAARRLRRNAKAAILVALLAAGLCALVVAAARDAGGPRNIICGQAAHDSTAAIAPGTPGPGPGTPWPPVGYPPCR